jgi:hypothetical protein
MVTLIIFMAVAALFKNNVNLLINLKPSELKYYFNNFTNSSLIYMPKSQIVLTAVLKVLIQNTIRSDQKLKI